MPESIHSGHRERVRKEIIKNGFDENTPPHKIIEFLLFYCISRKDTNPLAHRLINRFGSIPELLDAPLEEIAAVEGMSESSALLIKSILPIARIYFVEKANEKATFNSLDDIGRYALNQYIGVTNEQASIMAFDGKGKLLGFEFLLKGDISSVGLSFRDTVTRLMKLNAVSAVLIHNHPSGIAVPSPTDAVITQKLSESLANSGIYLIDHIILGFGDFVSMAQSKEYSYLFKNN
ncbi:MAG: RadC family protein [Clostridia bacterium]|nr:RadC family protein [Clostridia bacterium]